MRKRSRAASGAGEGGCRGPPLDARILAHRRPRRDPRPPRRLGPRALGRAEEREALARRLQLLSLECLEGRLRIRAEGAEIVCEGRLTARLAQACVVTLAPVAAELERAVSWRFSPKPAELADALEEGDEGALFYEPHGPDLGEALGARAGPSRSTRGPRRRGRGWRRIYGGRGGGGRRRGCCGRRGRRPCGSRAVAAILTL